MARRERCKESDLDVGRSEPAGVANVLFLDSLFDEKEFKKPLCIANIVRLAEAVLLEPGNVDLGHHLGIGASEELDGLLHGDAVALLEDALEEAKDALSVLSLD